MDKPNIILDNTYKKVISFHSTWTPSVDNVLVASNITDAIEKAEYLLHKYIIEDHAASRISLH